MALAHVVEGKTEAAYRRGDLFEKRRRLMDAWADYCAKLATPSKVVVLKSAEQLHKCAKNGEKAVSETGYRSYFAAMEDVEVSASEVALRRLPRSRSNARRRWR